MKKRITALLLTLVMVLSLFPTTVFAVGRGTQIGGKETVLSWRANRRSSESGLQVTVTGSGLSGKELSVDVLKDAEAERYFNAIEAAGNTLINPMALDIKILDNGSEWQPAGTVEVAITRQGASLSDKVYHFVPLVSIEPESVGTEASTEPAAEELTYEELASTTEGETATVTTRHFSVYIVGEKDEQNRLIVNFSAAGSNVAQMYVKKDDDMETVVYEPSFDLPAGTIFKGWTTKADYTVADINNGKTIEEVRSDITGKLPPENDAAESEAVTYYAMLFKQYKVTYLNPQEGSLSQDTVEFPYDPDNTNPEMEYTVNFEYTPDDENHGFLGWLVHEGTVLSSNPAPETTPEGAVYKVGTKITISGDVIFSADAPEGHWLVFNENGKGGTYNAPQFVRSGAVTQEPCAESAMIRNGYRFVGWYKDEACTAGNEFTFGGTLDAKTTIYAKWIANEKADYTIIIWKQNLAGDGFDFEESITLEGNVGQNVSTVTATGTGNDRYATVNGTAKRYTGFHLKEYDTPVEIKPENNAVVNVYYDRNEYTLTFIDNDAVSSGYVTYVYDGTTYTDATLGNEITNSGNIQTLETNAKDRGDYKVSRYGGGMNRTYAVKVGDKWYQITDNGEYVWSDWCTSITSVTDGNPTGVVYTITALYQQPIGDHFPIQGTNGAEYPTGCRWSPQSNLTVDGTVIFTKGVVVSYIDTMPAGDMTFTYGTSSASLKTMVYWIEALNGEPSSPDKATTTRDGVVYEEYKTVKANYTRITVEDYIDIPGYEHAGADKETEEVTFSSGETTRQYIDGNGSIATEVNFYFDRLHYAITYLDGAYVDGNSNPMDEIKHGEWKRETNIAFGADVSDYEDYEPAAPAGFVFEGWYLDDTCTTKATFDKMPEGGMTVYAKWRQIQYRVFLHPQAGTDTTLDWGSTSQQLNFRISYDGTVSLPTGRRTGYEFYGWYTTPNGASGTGFTSDMRLNASVADLLADYDKTRDFTDPMDKWGNGATWNSDAQDEHGNARNRFWITKKLDLYAKWGAVLEGGANGIGVIYSLMDTVNNVNGSGTAPTDDLLYKDGTNANAAPGVKAATTGWKFDHWVMQKWDSNANAYVDVANSVIYAGAEFPVSASNARIQTVDGITTYTIQLRAAYVPEDEPTPTSIPWFQNDGTAAFHIDGEDGSLMINEAVNIQAAPSRAGYDFLGWAFVDMGSTAEEAAAFLADTDNYTQDNLTIKVYYNNGKFYSDAAFTKEVKQVAADEADPYHAIFAVWQPKYVYIFHASTGDLEPVLLTGTIDLTDHVAGGKLYGGYYSAYGAYEVTAADKARAATAGKAVHVTDLTYDGSKLKYDGTNRYWVKTAARRDYIGTAIPASELTVGDVLYLKEVDGAYLHSRISFVYDVLQNDKLENLYLITAVDDNYYASVSFTAKLNQDAKGPYRAKLASTFTITQRNSSNKQINDAGAFGLTRGYVGFVDVTEDLLKEGATFTMTPQWTTFDGVVVEGTPRTFAFTTLTKLGIQEVTVTNP